MSHSPEGEAPEDPFGLPPGDRLRRGPDGAGLPSCAGCSEKGAGEGLS